MNKNEFKAFLSVTKGHNTLETISKNIKLSISAVSEIISRLVDKGFCRKERRKGHIKIYISKTGFVQKLLTFLNATPLFKSEEFLTGLNLRILTFCVLSPKTSKVVSKYLKVSLKSVQNKLSILGSIGVLNKSKGFYIFNKIGYSNLAKFLESYKNFYPSPVYVLWRFEDEVVYEAENENEFKGVLTGLSRYEDLGVPLYFTRFCCYIPKKKLSKEEIFIHSILEIDAIRIEELVLAFYLKHKMNMKRLRELAEKYDCLEKLKDLNKILRLEQPKELDKISEKELKEFFKQYKIKWKKHLIKKV